jgi:xanthine dehydrogenase accessory factor
MGFDIEALQAAIARHGRVARVVIAGVRGSGPREVGASMLVWDGGQSGTIGGGTLEFEMARRAVSVQGSALTVHALGPELGQCCGGSVQILTEVFEAGSLPVAEHGVVARPVSGGRGGSVPLAVTRVLAEARQSGVTPDARLMGAWFVEPVAAPSRALWIWGAGHVGRALVGAFAPLPEFEITWVDIDAARFPDGDIAGVQRLPAARPEALVPHAPKRAEHVIVTYSHALDLELCHALLGHGFGFAGLIGSKSKWARFQSRLAALGHSAPQISRITCPIGDPALGKHPQAIAVGVVSSLLRREPDILAKGCIA